MEVRASGYAGGWRIDGHTQTGDGSVDLAAGSYALSLAGVIGTAQVLADISVSPTGDVASSDPDRVRRIAPGILELVSHPIIVRANGYVGTWRSGADVVPASSYTGDQTIRLVPATYQFSLRAVVNSHAIYTVAVDGTVSTASDRLVASDRRLSLPTHSVDFAVNGYVGRWWSGADSVLASLYQGDHTVTLAAGDYQFSLYGVANSASIYTVATDGTVSTEAPRIVATGRRVELPTHPVRFEVNGYPGRWWSGADAVTESFLQGDQTVLVAAGEYRFFLQSVANSEAIYTVSTGGDVATESGRITVSGNTIRLATHAVEIRVNGYLGRWWSGADAVSASFLQGDQTVTLAAGDYRFQLQSVANSLAVYTVASDGTVSTESDRLTASGTTVSLLTHTVEVDVGGYLAHWWSGADVLTMYEGDQTLVLGAGDYRFSLRAVANSEAIYTVATDGSVSTESDRLIASDRRITLPTHEVEFDVSGYPGRWWWGSDPVMAAFLQGNRTVTLAAGDFRFQLHGVARSDAIYTVAIDGTVSTDSDRIVASGRRVTLPTHPVEVDVSDYPGRWWSGADVAGGSFFAGDQTLTLAAGDYRFQLHQVAESLALYSVATDGSVSTSATEHLEANGSTVRLLTTPIEIDVRGYPGQWLAGADNITGSVSSGDRTLALGSGIYTFDLVSVTNEQFRYRVSPAQPPGFRLEVLDGDSARVEPADRLVLRTRSCTFDVGHYAETWYFGDPTPFRGSQDLCLAPGSYTFRTRGTQVEYELRTDGSGGWQLVVQGDTTQPLPDGHSLRIFFGSGSCQRAGCEFTGPMRRVSVSSAGEQGNGASYDVSMSADGTRFVYVSDATNLTPGETQPPGRLFVRDLASGETRRLGRAFFTPRLTGDGESVVYCTYRSWIFPGDPNGVIDVYVQDIDSGAIDTVNVSSSGVRGDRHAQEFAVSADGRRIVFSSHATNLIDGQTLLPFTNIYLRDRVLDQTTRISTALDGGLPNQHAYAPSVSADGQVIAFFSWASNLVAGDDEWSPDVFVFNLRTGERLRIPTSPNRLTWPYVSGDGRVVTFTRENAVFYDLTTHTETALEGFLPLTRVSGMPSEDRTMSADGRFALVTPRNPDLSRAQPWWIYDRARGTTCHLDFDSDLDFVRWLDRPTLSADGTSVAFASSLSRLVPGDTNGVSDVFVYRLRVALFSPNVIDAVLRFPDLEPRTLPNVCDFLPDCGFETASIDPRFADIDWESRFSERFSDPAFPEPEEPDEREGFSFFVRTDLSGALQPVDGSLFEPDAWSLSLSFGTIDDGVGAGTLVLDDFLEVPFDIDGSGTVGDSEGEGVLVFFASTHEVIDTLAQLGDDDSFEMEIENRTDTTSYVSAPLSGLPSFPTAPPALSDGPRDIGCAPFCELDAGSYDVVQVGPLSIFASDRVGPRAAVVAGEHVDAALHACTGDVSDLWIPEAAVIDFGSVCADGHPQHVRLTLSTTSAAAALTAFDVDGAEVASAVLAATSIETVALESATGIDSVEIRGVGDDPLGAAIVEACWDCTFMLVEPATTSCEDLADAVDTEDGSITTDALMIEVPFAGESSAPGYGWADVDGDGTDELWLPLTPPEEVAARIDFSAACSQGNVVDRVTVRVYAQEAMLEAYGQDGASSDVFTLSSTSSGRELTVVAEQGIAWIELRGPQIVVDEICWDCAEGPPSEPQFRRDDVNLDGRSDLSDPVTTLGYLFLGGFEPACSKALDFDDSGTIDLTDPIGWLNWLFLGGPEPALPHTACGADPTPDALSCESYSRC